MGPFRGRTISIERERIHLAWTAARIAERVRWRGRDNELTLSFLQVSCSWHTRKKRPRQQWGCRTRGPGRWRTSFGGHSTQMVFVGNCLLPRGSNCPTPVLGLENQRVGSCGLLQSSWRGRGSFTEARLQTDPRGETETGENRFSQNSHQLHVLSQSPSWSLRKQAHRDTEKQIFLLSNNHRLGPTASPFGSCLDGNHFSFLVRPCSEMGLWVTGKRGFD